MSGFDHRLCDGPRLDRRDLWPRSREQPTSKSSRGHHGTQYRRDISRERGGGASGTSRPKTNRRGSYYVVVLAV